MKYENIIYITVEEAKKHSYEHCKNSIDRLLSKIDSDHLFDFISKLDEWAPDCYWKGKLIQGELMWAVYSYLVNTQLLIIENQYWVKLPQKCASFGNHSNQYTKKDEYYNPLESIIYIPILNKLVKEGYYQKIDDWQYILGPKPLRDIKLNQLGI